MSSDHVDPVSWRPYPLWSRPLDLRLLAGLCRLAQQHPRMSIAEIIRTAKEASRDVQR